MFTVAYDYHPRSGGRPARSRARAPRLDELPNAPVQAAGGPERDDPRPPSIAELILEERAREGRRDRRSLQWAVAAAVLFHAVLLAITWPEVTARPAEFEPPKRIHFVPLTRFKPPPPPKGQQQPPRRRAKKVPIPDPTPHDPEPIVQPEIDLPPIELPEVSEVTYGIPDPPSTGFGSAAGSGGGPYQVGGTVSAPKRIYDPLPPYTEEARLARIQGPVILSCVIDSNGRVVEVKVLKGLTLGLTESAVETVRTWRFEPAMRDGEPVPVYFNLVVNFHLQ
jgi:TonB family protein